jgi:hypothetical protein
MIVESSASLTSGGIAGVVIACVILVVLVVVVAIMLIRGRRSKIRAEVKLCALLARFALSPAFSQPHIPLSKVAENNSRNISINGNLPKFATPALINLEETKDDPNLVV